MDYIKKATYITDTYDYGHLVAIGISIFGWRYGVRINKSIKDSRQVLNHWFLRKIGAE